MTDDAQNQQPVDPQEELQRAPVPPDVLQQQAEARAAQRVRDAEILKIPRAKYWGTDTKLQMRVSNHITLKEFPQVWQEPNNCIQNLETMVAMFRDILRMTVHLSGDGQMFQVTHKRENGQDAPLFTVYYYTEDQAKMLLDQDHFLKKIQEVDRNKFEVPMLPDQKKIDNAVSFAKRAVQKAESIKEANKKLQKQRRSKKGS
jgi:hypothetical protein